MNDTLDAVLDKLLSGNVEVVDVCAFVDLLKDAPPAAAVAAISRLLTALAQAQARGDALLELANRPTVSVLPTPRRSREPLERPDDAIPITPVTTWAMGEEGGLVQPSTTAVGEEGIGYTVQSGANHPFAGQ